jgi:23S rRNA (uracil1939-C5)-methyltransferase
VPAQPDEGAEPSEPLVLEPSALVAGGDALARESNGRVVFVRGALPGERVAVRMVGSGRDFGRAETLEVLRRSPDRVEPPCPMVAEGCGGCDLQHVAPAALPALKASIVADALRRIGRVADPVVHLAPSLPPTGFRTTVRVAVRGGRAGFRRARSHDIVTVEHCLVAHPALDELLRVATFGSVAREATLRVGGSTGERLVIVDPNVSTSIFPDDVRVIGSDELRRGRRAWFHDEVAGMRFRISAGSFFQSRTDGAAALVDAVRSAVGWPLPSGTTLVDAYAGVGLFAAALTREPDGRTAEQVRVTAIERGRSSASDARINLADREADVIAVDVTNWTVRPADVVVADPAREGLGKTAVAPLAATGAEKIVLVSCDAAALGRDVRLFGEAGYELETCTLVDLFPHSHHVEVVSSLRRATR